MKYTPLYLSPCLILLRMLSFIETRARSFRYAFAGWWYVIRTQRNAWIHAVVSVAVVVVGIVVLAAGRLGEQIEKPSSDTTPGPTRTPGPTVQVLQTATPPSGETAPTLLPADTLEPDLTGIPPLPLESTQAPDIAPTPQTARVSVFGGVWLRDAPNGGTIDVLPEGSIVEFLNGSEFGINQQIHDASYPLMVISNHTGFCHFHGFATWQHSFMKNEAVGFTDFFSYSRCHCQLAIHVKEFVLDGGTPGIDDENLHNSPLLDRGNAS